MRRPEFIARQSSNPRGWLGRIIARIMSVETIAENHAALELLELKPTDRLLEVGCGHGRTLWEAAEIVTQGVAVGVDVSDDMVRMARQRRSSAKNLAPVEIHPTDGVDLPFADCSFDKVFSVHTIYFWKRPEATLGEIARVIAPRGTLVLAFRTKEDPAAALFPESVYRFYTVQDVHDLLGTAGFDSAKEASGISSGNGLLLLKATRSLNNRT